MCLCLTRAKTLFLNQVTPSTAVFAMCASYIETIVLCKDALHFFRLSNGSQFPHLLLCCARSVTSFGNAKVPVAAS